MTLRPRPAWIVAVALLPVLPGGTFGGTGAGELSLDRGAVAALVDLRLAEGFRAGIPGAALAGVRLAREGRVEFRDGGIEFRVRVSVPVAGVSAVVPVRYRPRVDREGGTVRLVPEVVPSAGQSLPVDPARVLPVVALPRLLDQEVPGGPTGRTRLTLAVQGVEVRDDRVVLRFGLLTRPVPARGSPR